MRWLERLERYFNWMAFPGLIKYLGFLGLITYFMKLARPDLSELLDFNRAKILEGEVWRAFTFAVDPGPGEVGAFGVFLRFMAMMVAILISDSLDNQWGPTRTTLYVLTTWLLIAASQFVFGSAGLLGSGLLYLSVFFAFATYFPKEIFQILFIIPVQVRFLAWLSAILLAITVFSAPVLMLIVVPALLPYALWVLPDVVRGKTVQAGAMVRRSKFNAAQMPKSEAFHRCESCNRTEQSNPQLNFFTLPDGKEYCEEHLPPEYSGKK